MYKACIFQLDSLRKGEGLTKDVDETVLANTFDPDDSKYEKSNKKKQRILDGNKIFKKLYFWCGSIG